MLVQVLLTFIGLSVLPISFLDHLLAVSVLSHPHQDQRDALEVLVVVLVFFIVLPSLFSIVLVSLASLLSNALVFPASLTSLFS